MKIRHRLLLILAMFILLASLAIDLTAQLIIDRAVSDRVVERLAAESELLARRLETDWPLSAREADAQADEAGAALGLRVTIIDASGAVLGDSHVPLAEIPTLENHPERPEMAQAAIEGYGISGSFSASAGHDMRYLARRVGPAGSPRGYIRLAISSADLQAISGTYRTSVTIISLVSMGLLAGVAYAAVRRFSGSMEKVSRAADQVASGKYNTAIDYEANDEIGDLVASIDRMRRELIEQMARTEKERRLLASILGGLREGILVVGQGRRLLLMNDSVRKAFSVPRDLPEGAPMIQVVWDRVIQEAYEQALAGNRDVSRRIDLAGGRSFQLTVVPFSDGERPVAGAIGLFFDVTRLDALERVRREFVADISHELRTPLASLKASAETLLAGALSDPPEANRFLGILMKNAGRMEAILNDLTDLSLIETGAITLSPSPVDLASVLREAVSAMAPRASARQVSIELRAPIGISLHADRRRLDQILMNLLDNAVKFNKEGGSVLVSAQRDNGKIILAVEDTGPGIPPDSLEKVFNRFYRADRARSQEVPGTGLGLAIVKHLVRLHGGEIRAENRETAGARFVLELPLIPPSVMNWEPPED